MRFLGNNTRAQKNYFEHKLRHLGAATVLLIQLMAFKGKQLGPENKT